jgi:hypothetical protein
MNSSTVAWMGAWTGEATLFAPVDLGRAA